MSKIPQASVKTYKEAAVTAACSVLDDRLCQQLYSSLEKLKKPSIVDHEFKPGETDEYKQVLAEILSQPKIRKYAANRDRSMYQNVSVGRGHIDFDDRLQDAYLTLTKERTIKKLVENSETMDRKQLQAYIMMVVNHDPSAQLKFKGHFIGGIKASSALLEEQVDLQSRLADGSEATTRRRNRETAEQLCHNKRLEIAEQVLSEGSHPMEAALLNYLRRSKNALYKIRTDPRWSHLKRDKGTSFTDLVKKRLGISIKRDALIQARDVLRFRYCRACVNSEDDAVARIFRRNQDDMKNISKLSQMSCRLIETLMQKSEFRSESYPARDTGVKIVRNYVTKEPKPRIFTLGKILKDIENKGLVIKHVRRNNSGGQPTVQIELTDIATTSNEVIRNALKSLEANIPSIEEDRIIIDPRELSVNKTLLTESQSFVKALIERSEHGRQTNIGLSSGFLIVRDEDQTKITTLGELDELLKSKVKKVITKINRANEANETILLTVGKPITLHKEVAEQRTRELQFLTQAIQDKGLENLGTALLQIEEVRNQAKQ